MKIAQDEILGKQPDKNPEPQRGGTKLASQWIPAFTAFTTRNTLPEHAVTKPRRSHAL